MKGLLDHNKPSNAQSSLGDTINITQNISFTSDVKATVKEQIMQEAPKIAEQTAMLVRNKNNRGGVYKGRL